MNDEFEKTNDSHTENDENKNAISADLIRGHINTIILRTLYERDKYGYEIIDEIEKRSHGQYSLKQPTLYSALKRLENQGYINAYWKTDEVSLGGRRKYYTLTDSGREISEKNQSEWEYSRTVIDSLISDKSFDFSQPAPSYVNFKILKKSTSRVPLNKNGYDDDEDDEADEYETFEDTRRVQVNPQTITFTEQETSYEQPQQVLPVREERIEEPAPLTAESKQVTPPQNSDVAQSDDAQSDFQENKIVRMYEDPAEDDPTPMNEEQRRIVHENYLKLLSQPIKEPEVHEVDVVPAAEEIDTEKLIYNNKPETERDYRNLINNLFVKTIKHSMPVEEQPIERATPAATVKLEDVHSKADNDGLRVNSSDYVVTGTRKKGYNRGNSLFKSSLIISIVLLLEFTLCLMFKNELRVDYAYPFIILALAVAQLAVFGVLYYTDFGKSSRKPSSNLYISACIVITVILIFIIFIVSILLKVNFGSVGDVMAKIIIPCLIALNIPAFAVCFYAFSK